MSEVQMQECGTLLLNHPLKSYTSWGVGGAADRVYFPKNPQDLSEFLASRPADEFIVWLGLGSNTLIRDGGIRGTVIITQKGLREIKKIGERCIYAQAGVSSGTLARATAREGWAGLEFLAGVPGTVGGALAMNAGCHGAETWPRVVEVETIDRSGRIRVRHRDEFEVAYREVHRPAEEWFLSGTFELTPSTPEDSKGVIKELLAHRAATQPTHLPSGGSVFRNPPGDHAGRLIESCGIKGCRIGQAMVSPKHANFIVSLNEEVKASDIEFLIEFVQEQVYQRHGVRLQSEVHTLGEAVPAMMTV